MLYQYLIGHSPSRAALTCVGTNAVLREVSVGSRTEMERSCPSSCSLCACGQGKGCPQPPHQPCLGEHRRRVCLNPGPCGSVVRERPAGLPSHLLGCCQSQEGTCGFVSQDARACRWLRGRSSSDWYPLYRDTPWYLWQQALGAEIKGAFGSWRDGEHRL